MFRVAAGDTCCGGDGHAAFAGYTGKEITVARLGWASTPQHPRKSSARWPTPRRGEGGRWPEEREVAALKRRGRRRRRRETAAQARSGWERGSDGKNGRLIW
ncbi:hypothetical protein C2845_PM05G25050 [Panicum miliaceum]|uniref:Uncharacterized protein n=1 Tax=Panicum miliaceum TaxID=4540 RepID=A0A3L6T2T4_PANMI|nr:hypothetical protein C2845_PM05G25050 [Panicum miliaceum]